MTSSDFVELFRSADLRVKHAHRGGALCVVTFDSLTETADLERPAFAEEFLATRAISAVHIVPAGNRWYQEPELDEALARIRAALQPYGRTVGYGSSMGGYAALRFADALDLGLAVAISPQYSMDPQIVPFENRWPKLVGAIRWRPALRSPLAAGRPTAVIYDPHHLPDRRHAELIARDTAAALVPIPYAGHPAGTYLAECGVLVRMILALFDGTTALAPLIAEARRARRQTPAYWSALTIRALDSGLPRAASLARAAVRHHPETYYLWHHLALVLLRARDFQGAAEAAARARALAPTHPAVLRRHAQALAATGRLPEARAVAKGAGLSTFQLGRIWLAARLGLPLRE